MTKQFKGLRTINKPEQPMSRTGAEKCAREYFKTTEQPNPNLLIVKKIQSLMSEASENLDELDKNIQFLSCDKPLIIRQAHEDITQLLENVDMFEKTTLYELQKALE